MGRDARTGLGILIVSAAIIAGLLSRRGTGPGPGQAAVEASYSTLARNRAEAMFTPEPMPFELGKEICGVVDQHRTCSDSPLEVCVDLTTSDNTPQTWRIDSACKPYPQIGREVCAKEALETSFPGQYRVEGEPGWEYVE